MVDHSILQNPAKTPVLRLQTLVKLRWLAITGQVLAVLAVYLILGFPLPIVSATAIIAVSAALNLALSARFPTSHRLKDKAAVALLAYDVVQLAALLYLTGGLENPFAILFLAPVLISATTLPPVYTLALGTLAMLAATFLAIFHQPLPWIANEALSLPKLYVAGLWLSILLGLTFIGAYAWRVAEEARQIGNALAATELVLAREQHLSQLDGLAAAAAHELGTPLATIALVVKELDLAMKPGSRHKEDIELLKDQTQRCRQILSKIATLGTEPAGPLKAVRLLQLLEEVCAPQRPFGVKLMIEAVGSDPEPGCKRSPGLIYGLENLIENAVDFAATTVTVKAEWTADIVRISISDDGPGFANEVLNRMGEPYVSTRSQPEGSRSNTAGGLGLGLFIAKTLLERSGAVFHARNKPQAEQGALVSMTWKRTSFELDAVDVGGDGSISFL